MLEVGKNEDEFHRREKRKKKWKNVSTDGVTFKRIFNVLRKLVDNLGPVYTCTTSSIHRFAPAFT